MLPYPEVVGAEDLCEGGLGRPEAVVVLQEGRITVNVVDFEAQVLGK